MGKHSGKSNKFTLYIKALRGEFFLASWIPVGVGLALSYRYNGYINFYTAFLTFLCITFFHAGTNLANDYFDHLSGNDENNLFFTPFNGGSRFIQKNLIPAKNIFLFSMVNFVLGTVLGLYLFMISWSFLLLMIGLAGFFIGFFYTIPPLRIGYAGFGETAAGIAFGPLAIASSFLIQTGTINNIVWLFSIPIGIGVFLILLVNEFPDYPADKSVNKKTLIVRMGKRKGIALYCVLVIFIFIYTSICVFSGYFPKNTLILLILFPASLVLMWHGIKNLYNDTKFIVVNAGTILFYFAMGIIFIITCLIK